MEPEQSQPKVEKINNIFTEVTPLSKYLAMMIFIMMPFIGGWIGYKYAPVAVVEVEKNVDRKMDSPRSVDVGVTRDTNIDKFTSAILAVRNKYGYGPGPTYVSAGDKYLWFIQPHEKDGCNNYSYIDLDSGNENETNLSACPIVDVSSTYPFHVDLCPTTQSTVGESLCVTNLLTLEKRSIVMSDSPEVTSIKECAEGNYDPVCIFDIQPQDGGLWVRQYKASPREPYSIYTNTEQVGEMSINLFKEFGLE